MRFLGFSICALVVLLVAPCHGDAIPPNGVRMSSADQHAFLNAVCPDSESGMGCERCPSETGFRNNAERWDVRAVIFGHFASPQSEDALVSGIGCESHATGLGGSFLFTKNGLSWRKVRYNPGETANNCIKVAGADGRDRLICEWSDMHQGFGDTFLYLLDPGGDARIQENGLDIFLDVTDSLVSCVSLPDGMVISGAIASVRVIPAGEHRARISVLAKLGKARVSPKSLSDCVMSNFKHHPVIATVDAHYRFLYDGRKITGEPGNPPLRDSQAIAPATSWHPSSTAVH